MSGAVHSSDRVGARAPEARHFHLCHAMCLSSQQRAETRVLSDTPSVTMDTCKYGFIGGWRLAVGALLFRLSVVRAPAARARGRAPCCRVCRGPAAARYVSCIGHRASLWLFSSRIGLASYKRVAHGILFLFGYWALVHRDEIPVCRRSSGKFGKQRNPVPLHHIDHARATLVPEHAQPSQTRLHGDRGACDLIGVGRMRVARCGWVGLDWRLRERVA